LLVIGPVRDVVARLVHVSKVYIAQVPRDKPLPIIGEVLLIIICFDFVLDLFEQ
jgi:hypothetical protein